MDAIRKPNVETLVKIGKFELTVVAYRAITKAEVDMAARQFLLNTKRRALGAPAEDSLRYELHRVQGRFLSLERFTYNLLELSLLDGVISRTGFSLFFDFCNDILCHAVNIDLARLYGRGKVTSYFYGQKESPPKRAMMTAT